jgi:hypothetical protein
MSALSDRLLARAHDDAGCLVWDGFCTEGHPAHRLNGRTAMVRRTLFTELFGPLEGRIARMTCETPLCIKPRHITAMSRSELYLLLGSAVMGGAVRSASIQRAHRAGPSAKLKPEDVRRIRDGSESAVVLSAALGVSAAHVRKVRLHKVQRDYVASPWAGLLGVSA